MIVVVADTSPLNYLIQIDCDHVLPALYERVFVPAAVVEELHHPRTTAAMRSWLARTPSWLVVEDVDEPVDPQVARLDLKTTFYGGFSALTGAIGSDLCAVCMLFERH